MPTYGYSCKNCGHEFEQFQSITDKSLRTCPSCGKRTLKRLIGVGAGIIFKGSGFYATDYRSDSYKKGVEKEKPASSDKKEGTVKTKESAGSESGVSAKDKKKSA